MIKIRKVKGLSEEVYFEDIDATVSSQEYCWEVYNWYIQYFSTEVAAIAFL
ncbi:hypothetical protein NVP1187O_158 [Vibrio phage 1.187.O._10N.286.49.F1]|nr:hypothetical protein NVP1187O_158 [Vibrio phage 1.187.O._10N.286.49.F1]